MISNNNYNQIILYYILILSYLQKNFIVLANIEKEVFTCTIENLSKQVYDQIDAWILSENISTLKSSYTIIRHQSITPFTTILEFEEHHDNNNQNVNAISEKNNKEHWYLLSDLIDGETYETRVSYAASSPTNFVMEIYDFERIYDGYSYIPGKENQAVIYNIVLETLLFGIVPRVAIKLIALLVFTVVFSYFILVPSIWKFLVAIRDLDYQEKQQEQINIDEDDELDSKLKYQ
ncbi:9554_t:CDS:2 [Ambispora gerdemannii]|uniref:9554_t:CDS:1 n=1 Tax=Ambispora gerdemannii TaxID=144530 RepID=A0A9N8Z706_9GLOM|nr:9554_t:CDS:2 [Ambispora gerdemannii]